MAFDIEGARAAGYSDGEIADFLGKDSGFDVAGAQKAGYEPAEIVAHLSSLKKPAAPAAATGRATDAEIDSTLNTPINSDVVNEAAPAKPGGVAAELANLRDSFFTGVDNTRASVKTVNMGMVANRLQKTTQRLKDLEARGEGESTTARQMRSEIASAKGQLPRAVGEMTEAQGDAQRGAAISTRPAVAKVGAAKTFGEAWEAFKEAPYDVIAGVTATSLPSTLPALVAAAVMGPGAGALAMGANSAAVEGGSALAEFARDAGIDVTNAKAVEGFFTNPQNLAAAMSYAGKRAGVIGALDAASGGLAGKTIAPAMKSQIARQAVNLPTQMAAQAALGAGGEAGAQLVTKGEIDQPGQVLMEAAGELGGAPMEVAAFGREARLAAREKSFADKYPTEPGTLPGVPPAPVDPVAAIGKAQTVDEAIAVAQAALQSSTAVDNIGEILKQNMPAGLINSAPAATENVAGLSPDVAQTNQAITELEAANVSPPPASPLTEAAALDEVPAGAAAGNAGQPAGAGALLEAVPAEPGAGALTESPNVQNQTPAGPAAQGQAAPAQTPETGAVAGSPPAATGTATGDAAVQAVGIGGKQVYQIGGRDPSTRTYEHRADGRLARTIEYPDGQSSTETFVTDKQGDEHWVSTTQYQKGEYFPEQLSQQKAEVAIRDDLAGTSATPKIAPATAPVAPQRSARQVAIDAERARIESKRTESKAARAAASAAPAGLSVGMMPNSAEPVTVKDGVVYIGKYPANNFDTGADVLVDVNATLEQIRDALIQSGALGKKARVFGVPNKAPAIDGRALPATDFIATEKPDAAQQRADFAASEKTRKVPGTAARTRAHAENPFKAFLGKHGISNSLAAEFAPGRKERQAAMVQGYGPMFRKSGPLLDALAARAVEEGFLLTPDEAKLQALIADALRGKRIIPQYAQGVAGDEGMARAERAADLEQQDAEAQNAEVEAENQAERDAIQAVADLPDTALEFLSDADIVLTASNNVSEADFLRALGATEQEIEDATAKQSEGARQGDQGRADAEETAASATPGDPQGRDSQAGGGEGLSNADARNLSPRGEAAQGTAAETDGDGGRDAALRVQSAGPVVGEAGERGVSASGNGPERGPGLQGLDQGDAGTGADGAGSTTEGLTSPTPADVLAQQQRAADGDKADAKAATTAADRARADAERGEFTLTGSDRGADADPNQRPMFSRAERATDILDAAEIKGKDRLEALRDVRAGLITPDELEAAYPAKVDQTETPAFKKWFGDSKVVNEDGSPKVVYHGTAGKFWSFDTKRSIGGKQWFTSNKSAIEQGEVGAQGSGRIIDAYLSIKKPAGWKEYDQLTTMELLRDGYDGLILPDGDETTYVVFNPKQIKSASKNNGNFDPARADIRFSRAPAMEPVQTKSGATAFKTPEIALANPRLNVRQPGGAVTRIDYEIRDRKLYAQAISEGATPADAREEASVGTITLDVDKAGVFKSLRNIEVFQSKRGNAIAEKVVGGIVESLPAGAKLHIHDILPTATGFWDKMGASFPRSEDFMEANLSPEQFRNAYDTRQSAAGTRGQRQESRTAEDAGTGQGRPGADGAPAPRAGIRNPSTVERVQAAVAELIGGKQLPNKLGRVVATTASEIKSYWEPQIGQNVQLGSEGEAGQAQAFFDPRTRTVFLIVDNIPAGDEMAVAAHELMHKHGQAVLGAEGWDKLHSVINSWANSPEDSDERAVYTYARSRVEAVGMELSSQEMFPYAVEAAIKMGVKPSLIAKQGTVARWLGSVKYAMQQAWGKVTGKPEAFKTQDLVDLAFGIAQMENPESAAAMGKITDAPVKTDSPEFERWFGESKVVDSDGNPQIVYHGTSASQDGEAFSSFDTYASNYGLMGMGGYFTADPAVASSYTTKGRGATPTVYPAYLSIKNPIDMEAPADVPAWEKQFDDIEQYHEGGDTNEAWYRAAESSIADQEIPMYEGAEIMQDGLRAMGFDGITHVGGGRVQKDGARHRVYVAFDPEQVKSATGNNGDFDGSNPDIRYSRTATQTGTPAIQPNLSPWRDETGRLQFAPGAWLYDQIGKAASPMLVRLGMKAATPELRRQLRQMKIDVEKAQEVAVAIARETTKLSEAERAMVSDLVEQELKVGVIPPAHAIKLAAMINDAMGRQTDELVSLGMLTKDSANKWRGKYLPRYYESKLKDKLAKTGATWADALMGLTGRQSVMKGIKGKNLKGRGLYETIPEAQLKDYEALGWEVRDPDYTPSLPTVDGTVQVWRDFSPAEREKMGEIRDAGFRFVMGYMQTQRDIALGRMFERMAQDPDSSSRLEKEGYVQVPTTVVSGTGAKVYGKLAGRWVPTETMSQLSNIEESTSAAWQMYRKAMAVWKMGKTAMNPVSHVNNVVSNLTMAHLAGVSYLRGDKYLAAARDFVKKTPMLQEAKDNGLFLGTLSDTELMNSMPEELRILAQKQESTTLKVARTGFDVMTMFLRKPMGAAYQAEDTFFRYLIYKDARDRGTDPQDAVDYAQRYIFTYDDLPKGARRIRDFGIPFFSYTYKAAPALLHTALTHPLRMAAPAAVLWGINAAAYAIATGDDDDDWQDSLQKYITDPAFRAKAREQEKLEREHLPPWNKGTTALLTPKMIRLGMDEVTKLPLFIDVSRIIPGGDLFDISPNAGGIPLPQPITPSHPLFTTAVAMLGNKDLFRGKDLVDKNDTKGEAAEKRAAWMWTQLAPAVAAGSYHWERGMNALAQATGKEVTWMPDVLGGDATGIGRDGLPVQPKYAAMQTFGIKVRPMDLDTSAAIDKNMQRKLLRDIDAEMSALRRLESKGAVSPRAVDKARELADMKKDRIKQGLTVDGSERD